MYSEPGNNVLVSFSLPRGDSRFLYQGQCGKCGTRKGTFLIPHTSLHNMTTAFQ